MKTTSTVTCLVALALLAAACSDESDDATSPATEAPATTTTVPRPPGPSADLSEELTGGDGVFIGAASQTDLEGAGYVEREYVAAGTATSYRADGELPGDGRWTLEPDDEAAYRTRALVRRPADAARFSGTVVVEWLNVSGGVDADPEFASIHEELVRAGDAWVGVSAQLIGVMGGPVLVEVDVPEAEGVAGEGLVKIDPARYGSLEHPGDGYAFDIFTQVARALRAGGPATGGLQPQRLLAAGESQSAFALVTYFNGVQPLTNAFDGFFVHSRGGGAMALVEPGKSADIAGSIGATPTILRTDQDVPALELQSEGDVIGVLNSIDARQDDSDTFRLWEVAGTAHADAHLLGPVAESIDCGTAVNDGPLHIVAKAALRSLDTWVRTGEPPAEAARIETTADAQPAVRRDADGIALGGIRTPPVDVPVDVLSGVPAPDSEVICVLSGSTTPLPDARLAELYPSRVDYEQRYDAGIDSAIAARFVLEEDRDALRGYAQPERIEE